MVNDHATVGYLFCLYGFAAVTRTASQAFIGHERVQIVTRMRGEVLPFYERLFAGMGIVSMFRLVCNTLPGLYISVMSLFLPKITQ